MKKLAAVLSMSLISSSLATSLIGTKQSVMSSSLCKKHSCVLKYSGLLRDAPESMKKYKTKEFEYSLEIGISLHVLRKSDDSILSAFLKYDVFGWGQAYNGNGDPYVGDFSMSFLGYTPSKSLNDTCLTDLYMKGNTLETPGIKMGIMGLKNKLRLVCSATLMQPGGFPSGSNVFVMASHD
ncbi:hypothetical protein [Deinococcus alpinitundrae]|uniref:hypothetical protein n=1 Tax=Deinococcus alpinitundrae TaxID=468913 RepID=UPI00137B61AA|nr:hypothetical protein [Deinococcus alpinitundrae]